MINFANNLKELRTQRNLTQLELALITGIKQQDISHYESNKSRPKIAKLALIAKSLDVKIDKLLCS